MPTRGVYFLASDGVYDWSIALLNSFRAFNPTLKLTMIPFNDDIDRIRRLSDEYRFEVLPEERVAHYDELGRSFTDRPAQIRMFRKLVVFEGDFESVLYLDSDVLVLSDLSRLFQGMGQERSIYFYDDDGVLNFVYPDHDLARRMVSEHGSVGFNAGAFGYSGAAISPEEIQGAARFASNIRAGVWSEGWDQVFMNVVADALDIPKVSFRSIYGRSVEVNPGLMNGLMIDESGSFSERAPRSALVPLIHYAGFDLGALMPYAKLWLKYRNASPSATLSLPQLAQKTDWAKLAKKWARDLRKFGA